MSIKLNSVTLQYQSQRSDDLNLQNMKIIKSNTLVESKVYRAINWLKEGDIKNALPMLLEAQELLEEQKKELEAMSKQLNNLWNNI